MATLAGNTIAETYPLLLKIASGGIDGDLRIVEDGDGTESALSIATDSVLVKGDGVKLYFYDADGGEHISADASGNLTIGAGVDLNLTATTDINIPVNVGLRFGDGGENIETDNTNLTITSGADIILAGTAVNITADTIDLSDATKDVTLNAAVDALNFDSNTLSIDASNNRVGIGTNAPSNDFVISDHAAATGNGMEFGAGASASTITVFNRTSASYTPLTIESSTLTIAPQSAVGLTVGAVADEADAIITNGADGGRYDVLTVQENGNKRWDLSFEGSGSTNSLMFASNVDDYEVSDGGILTLLPAGFIGLGHGDPKKMLHIRRPDTDCMIVLDAQDSVADKQICFAEDYGSGSTSGGDYWGVGVDASEGPDFVIAFDANSQASMGGDDDKLRIKSTGVTDITANDTGYTFDITNANGTGAEGLRLVFSGYAPNNTSKDFLSFQDSGGSKVRIYSNGDVYTTSGTDIQSLSDERLKENVANYTNGLEVINSLQPRTYTWKNGFGDGKDGTHYGFIAQEIKASSKVTDNMNLHSSIPVREDDGDKYNGVIDDETIFASQLSAKEAILISAIKELSAKVTALENA